MAQPCHDHDKLVAGKVNVSEDRTMKDESVSITVVGEELEKVLNVPQVAEALGLSKRTAYRGVERGVLTPDFVDAKDRLLFRKSRLPILAKLLIS